MKESEASRGDCGAMHGMEEEFRMAGYDSVHHC